MKQKVEVEIRDLLLTDALKKLARAARIVIEITPEARSHIQEANIEVTLHSREPRLEYALFYLVKNCSGNALTYCRKEERHFLVSMKNAPKKAPPPPEGKASRVLTSYRESLTKKDFIPDEVLDEHLAKLAEIGQAATATLAHELVQSADWRTRLLAVRALRPLEDPRAAPALIHALGDQLYAGVTFGTWDVVHDQKFAIRDEAIAALRAIGEPAHKELISTANNRRDPDQVHAVYGLSQIKAQKRVPTLIALAEDRKLELEVRRAAVKALTDRREGAQERLADLLPDQAVQDEVAKALRYSKDRAAIEPLMRFVRNAVSNYDLAMRAAHVIGYIDRDFTPGDTRDAVDYLLHFNQLENIERRLGKKGRPRLKYWSSSGCAEMRERAQRALALYAQGK